jgi:hypothetical protein
MSECVFLIKPAAFTNSKTAIGDHGYQSAAVGHEPTITQIES